MFLYGVPNAREEGLMEIPMLRRREKRGIIVGCGQLGARLAKDLCDRGYNITVIDTDAEAMHRLDESYSGYTVVADGTDIDVLEANGIKEADVLISTTDRDNKNLMVAEVANRVYGVARVYLRLNDEKKKALIDGFNIETLCPLRLCEEEFYRLSGLDTSASGTASSELGNTKEVEL